MTVEEINEFWRSLSGLQRVLVIDAITEYWNKGVPVPTDVYMQMTEEGLDVDQVQEYFMEVKNT